MISINILQIPSDRKTIDVEVTTDIGSTFSTVKLWTEDTYKESTKEIDLTSKLLKSSNTESFTIDAEDLDIKQFDGLYFIEFEDSNSLLQLSAVAELTTYKKCLLDNTLKILSSNTNVLKGEGCNNSDFNKLIYIHTILNALQASVISGYYGEAIDLFNILKKFCKNCSTCGNLNSILSLGTLNNNIILI